MKWIVAGLILLALYAATGSTRKEIERETREILDHAWKVQEELADTEEMREWVRYWQEAVK